MTDTKTRCISFRLMKGCVADRESSVERAIVNALNNEEPDDGLTLEELWDEVEGTPRDGPVRTGPGFPSLLDSLRLLVARGVVRADAVVRRRGSVRLS